MRKLKKENRKILLKLKKKMNEIRLNNSPKVSWTSFHEILILAVILKFVNQGCLWGNLQFLF